MEALKWCNVCFYLETSKSIDILQRPGRALSKSEQMTLPVTVKIWLYSVSVTLVLLLMLYIEIHHYAWQTQSVSYAVIANATK